MTRNRLKTPKAAAISGILFSILFLVAFCLLRISLPPGQLPPAMFLGNHAGTIALALSLIPFAGIAFLWFIGVLRNQLGEREDKFFATVFLGSGLLFLATLFSASAVVGAVVIVFNTAGGRAVDGDAFTLFRSLSFALINVYAIKMAAVFMISTSTVVAYTVFVPRYVALLGFSLALILLLGSSYLDWCFLVFPLWTLLLSLQILVDNLRQARLPLEESPALRTTAHQ
jgi:hypothetical protein